MAEAWKLDGPYEGTGGFRDIGESWKWRLSREDSGTAEIVVDVSRNAVSPTANNPADTREARRTKGRSAVEKALQDKPDNPPRRILCSTSGCREER
jgi:hypothetical protein